MHISVIQSEGMLLVEHPSYMFVFDLHKGKFSLSFLIDQRKQLVLQNATYVIYLAGLKAKDSLNPLFSSTDANDSPHSCSDETLEVETGSYEIIITKNYTNHSLTAEFLLTLDADKDYPLFALRVQNLGEVPIHVHSLCPIYISPEMDSSAKCLLCNNWHDVSFFKNGYQSWSQSEILLWGDRDRSSPLEFGRKQMESRNYDLIPEKGKKNAFYSDYFSVIYDRASTLAMVTGFVTHFHHLTSISLVLNDNPLASPRFLTASHADLIDIGEGQWCISEVLYVMTTVGRLNYLKNLQTYTSVTGEKMGTITGIAAGWMNIPTGYCTWYYYYNKVSELDLIANLDFFNRQKDEIPIEFIQLDDGYQASIGDWTDLNAKFPSGMQAIVDRIHAAGFKAGLWVAPFLVSTASKMYFSHPDWLIQDSRGKFMPSGAFNPAWGHGKIYVLDPTQTDVQAHLEQLFNTITAEWGFDYVKIDFIYAACLKGSAYSDQNATRVDAYRQGLAAIRRGVGDKTFILGCGAPLAPSIGYCNAMRIGPDTAARWEMLRTVNKIGRIWLPSLYPALHSTLVRSFLHQVWWINDPDCVIVRVDKSKLKPTEVQTQLTVFGLSGGMILASDNMTKVPRERVGWLQRLLPPYGPAALPLDLMDKKVPETFFRYLNATAPAEGILVSVMNFDSKTKDLSLELSFFGMSSGDYYHVFDYWGDHYLGRFRGDAQISLPGVLPHEHRYLVIKLFTPGDPQFISSSLHIGQGTLEVREFAFNEGNKRISFQVNLPGELVGRLVFYLPEIYAIDDRHSPGILVANTPNEYGIWKVEIAFRNSREYEIQLKFTEANMAVDT